MLPHHFLAGAGGSSLRKFGSPFRRPTEFVWVKALGPGWYDTSCSWLIPPVIGWEDPSPHSGPCLSMRAIPWNCWHSEKRWDHRGTQRSPCCSWVLAWFVGNCGDGRMGLVLLGQFAGNPGFCSPNIRFSLHNSISQWTNFIQFWEWGDMGSFLILTTASFADQWPNKCFCNLDLGTPRIEKTGISPVHDLTERTGYCNYHWGLTTAGIWPACVECWIQANENGRMWSVSCINTPSDQQDNATQWIFYTMGSFPFDTARNYLKFKNAKAAWTW